MTVPPPRDLVRQLPAAGGGDGVEARAAVVVAGAPVASDPAFLFEAEECGVDGALVERERARRRLLDAPGDAIAVQRAHRREGLEDHQVQGAVGNFSVGHGAFSSLSC
jgi:hypothetical protein